MFNLPKLWRGNLCWSILRLKHFYWNKETDSRIFIHRESMNEKLHLIQHRHAKQLKKYSALNMFSCQQPPTSEPSEPLSDTTLITMNTNTALYFDSVPQTQILTTAPNADWFTAEKRKGRIGSYLRDTWLKDTGLADSFLLKLQIQHECLKQDAPN